MFNFGKLGTHAAIVVASVMLSICATAEASAQRTMKNQLTIGVDVTTSMTNMRNPGIDLKVGQYLLHAYWFCGCSGSLNSKNILSAHTLRYADITIEGGYMHRLFSTRGRHLCLYCGGGAFIGYEFYDPWKQIPSHIETGLSKDGQFLYGINPAVDLTGYLSRRVAVTAGISVPVNFTSKVQKVRPKLKIGIRIDI